LLGRPKAPDQKDQCSWTIQSLCCKAPQSRSQKNSDASPLRHCSWQTKRPALVFEDCYENLASHTSSCLFTSPHPAHAAAG